MVNYKYSEEVSSYWNIIHEVDEITYEEKSNSWINRDFRTRNGDSNWWGHQLQPDKIGV
jgi:hypothetical protein